MKNRDYNKILQEVKSKYYSLKNTKVILKYQELRGSAKTRWSPFIGYYLIVNPLRLEKMSYLAIKGVFAHELAHVEDMINENHSYLGKIIQRMWWKVKEKFHHDWVKKEFKKVEYNADLRTIKMGFGRELLEFKKFIQKDYSPERLKEMKETYMSLQEVKKQIKELK